MERPSRRSAALSSSHASNDNATANGSDANSSSSSARHRRRRETSGSGKSNNNMSASQSDDDDETDSSSVAALDTGTSGSSSVTRSSKKLLQRDAKKRSVSQRGDNPASHGRDEELDGDDEHEEEEDDHDLSSSESHGHAHSSGGGGADGSSGVGKRERSLSNVSTTSSSSSIASDHNEEDLLAMQLEKLKELEKKKKMVEDGTLAEFCRRVTEFKEERNQLLETAEWHKSLQLKNSQDLYSFEVQRAHNLWQQANGSLKSEMLRHVDSLLTKLKQELKDLSTAEGALNNEAEAAETDAGASSAPPSDSTEPEDAPSEKEGMTEERMRTKAPVPSKRRKVGLELPEQTVRLPQDEIDSDLASILGERKQRAEESTARLNKKTIDNFKSERRRLFCGKYILEDGDEVVVSSPVTSEDYVGTISSVTDNAVYIKLSSGQKVRIYLELIEHKRCEVKPFLRGAAGLGALQTTGWVQCEPF